MLFDLRGNFLSFCLILHLIFFLSSSIWAKKYNTYICLPSLCIPVFLSIFLLSLPVYFLFHSTLFSIPHIYLCLCLSVCLYACLSTFWCLLLSFSHHTVFLLSCDLKLSYLGVPETLSHVALRGQLSEWHRRWLREEQGCHVRMGPVETLAPEPAAAEYLLGHLGKENTRNFAKDHIGIIIIIIGTYLLLSLSTSHHQNHSPKAVLELLTLPERGTPCWRLERTTHMERTNWRRTTTLYSSLEEGDSMLPTLYITLIS